MPPLDLFGMFKQDFGYDVPEIVSVGPVRGRAGVEWTFGMTPVVSSEEQMWILRTSKMYYPSIEARGGGNLNHEVANRLENGLSTVALATVTINGVAVWRFMEQAGFPLSDAEVASIHDAMFPPWAVREKVARFMRERVFSRDLDLVSVLHVEYQTKVLRPVGVEANVGGESLFRCNACSYMLAIPTPSLGVLALRLESAGSVFCPNCGQAAVPPKEDAKSSPNPP